MMNRLTCSSGIAFMARVRQFMPPGRNVARTFLLAWLLGTMLLAAAVASAGCGNGETASKETATGPAAVQTAAITTTGTPPALYTFAVCGDNRTLGIDNGVLPRIIDSAKARGASFLVNTGDVSNSGTSAELTRYKDLIESSGLNVYTAPGNHDVGEGGHQ